MYRPWLGSCQACGTILSRRRTRKGTPACAWLSRSVCSALAKMHRVPSAAIERERALFHFRCAVCACRAARILARLIGQGSRERRVCRSTAQGRFQISRPPPPGFARTAFARASPASAYNISLCTASSPACLDASGWRSRQALRRTWSSKTHAGVAAAAAVTVRGSWVASQRRATAAASERLEPDITRQRRP